MDIEKTILIATKVAVATILGSPETAASAITEDLVDNVIPCPIDDHCTYGVEATN